jgi:hypothetical protein
MSASRWSLEGEFVLRHTSGDWVTKYIVGGQPIYVPFVCGQRGKNCASGDEAKRIVEGAIR